MKATLYARVSTNEQRKESIAISCASVASCANGMGSRSPQSSAIEDALETRQIAPVISSFLGLFGVGSTTSLSPMRYRVCGAANQKCTR